MNWKMLLFSMGIGLCLITTLGSTTAFAQAPPWSQAAGTEVSIQAIPPREGIVKPVPEPKPKPNPSEKPKPTPLAFHIPGV